MRSPAEPLRRTAMRTVACRWVCRAALCFAPTLAGCQPFSLRGPVPNSVAMSRQLTQQGTLALERGDWTRSEKLLGQAVKSCPVDADARRRYAEVLWRRGAAAEAISQIDQARRLAAEDTEIAVLAGQWYLHNGQVDRALAAADDALAVDARCAPAWALCGQVAQLRGDLRSALAHYQRSLGYEPSRQEVLLRVAEVYRQLNQPERALVTLQALGDRYSPGEEPDEVLWGQGQALAALGRPRDAAEVLSVCVRRGNPGADLLAQLAECQLQMGRRTEAEINAHQALALDPNHARSRALLDAARLATRPEGAMRPH